MNILNIEHVSKTFGDKKVLDDVSLGIQEGDKIGIIGINGTGKTTLLRLLSGDEEPDDGEVIRANNLTCAYLPQNPVMPEEDDILAYVMEGQTTAQTKTESEARIILNKLGLPDHDVIIRTLSGGQRKRAALAKTLIHPMDVLILDEPTNHIDNEMAAYLEDYLKRFRGTLIMVTHDRYFLDRAANRIVEIDQANLYSYPGNYTEFLERKAQREEIELATERKRQSVMRVETAWAMRGARARSTKQKARLERLEALKNVSGPTQQQSVELDTMESRMGKKTIELKHISKSYEDKVLIRDFSYIFLKNARIGIIGPNGCGKSTLVKIIAGMIRPDSGTVEIGDTIRIGYFSQDQGELNDEQRVIDCIKDIAEYIPTKDGHISASKMLERFLFTDTMQYAPIGKLSGGEKKRLSLLKVLVANPNVLVLDEITNDLDIPTLIILEDFLDDFNGIVITVSHDRYFLDNVTERILSFEGDGEITEYMGNYADYLNARKRMPEQSEAAAPGQADNRSEDKKPAAKSWRENAPKKLKFTYNEQKEYETIDDDIASLEEKIAGLEEKITANARDYGRLAGFTAEKEAAETALEEKMDRWVYLNDLAERIEQGE